MFKQRKSRRPVLICVPSQTARGISPDCFSSFAFMEKPPEFTLFVPCDYHVAGAREKAARVAAGSGSDLLFIDSDMRYPAEGLKKLSDCIYDGADIACGQMWTKHIPSFPTTFRMTDHEDGQGRKVQRPYLGEGIEEIEGCGMAFTMISQPLLEKMAMRGAMFVLDPLIGGEDAYFCRKARLEHDAKIVCDFSVKTGHLGFVTFEGQDFTRNPDNVEYERIGNKEMLVQYGILKGDRR